MVTRSDKVKAFYIGWTFVHVGIVLLSPLLLLFVFLCFLSNNGRASLAFLAQEYKDARRECWQMVEDAAAKHDKEP